MSSKFCQSPKTSSRTAEWVLSVQNYNETNKSEQSQKITDKEMERLRQIVAQKKNGLHISDTGYVI